MPEAKETESEQLPEDKPFFTRKLAKILFATNMTCIGVYVLHKIGFFKRLVGMYGNKQKQAGIAPKKAQWYEYLLSELKKKFNRWKRDRQQTA